MKHIRFLVLLVFILLSACVRPTPQPSPLTRTPTPLVPVVASARPAISPVLSAFPEIASPTVTSLPSIPTRTPSLTRTAIPFPSETPTYVDGSPTPSVPLALSPQKEAVQCFKGPGIEYQPSYSFKIAEIVGKDQTGLWWYIQSYDSLLRPFYCWVSVKEINTAGNLSTVPVTEAFSASVTAVNIYLDGDDTQIVDCSRQTSQSVFNFRGEIVTDGPLKKLKYIWETDAGVKFTQEQTQVSAWDAPLQARQQISVPAQSASYSLTLRSIYPNELVWRIQFTVQCK